LGRKVDHADVTEDPGGGHCIPVILVGMVDEKPENRKDYG
jgi:hypothetical protein